MNIPRLPLACPTIISGALVALALAGCVTMSEGTYQGVLDYQPTPSRVRFEATVSMRTVHKVDPELEKLWHAWGNSDAGMYNYSAAYTKVIANDIVRSGLFTRFEETGPAVDYALQIVTTDTKIGADFALLIQYELTDVRARQLIGQGTLTVNYGPKMLQVRPRDRLPGAMQQVREAIVADLQKHLQQKRQKAAEQEATMLREARLEDLLIAVDSAITTARARNRAIVAAKTTQLPAILRDTRTDDLSALLVKIEQTILDLNHESQVAKDRAQQILAAGPGANPAVSADDLRDFAISYRERIELLKPISAAIKEEIANRNR